MVVLLPLRVPDQDTSRHAPHRGGVSSVLGAVAPDSPQGRALPVDPVSTCRPDHLPVESEHRTPTPPADLSLPIPGRRAARHANSSRELRRRETLACSSGRRVRRRMPGLECHRGGEDRSLSSRLFQRAGRRAGQRAPSSPRLESRLGTIVQGAPTLCRGGEPSAHLLRLFGERRSLVLRRALPVRARAVAWLYRGWLTRARTGWALRGNRARLCAHWAGR